MEVLKGKRSYAITRCELNALVSSHDGVTLDIGTGDGRAVLHEARASPSRLVIGLDACRENLHAGSRMAPSNALFAIANALSLPDALDNLAQHITITFPWGSLLHGLLDGTDCLGAGLRRVALPGARFEIVLALSVHPAWLPPTLEAPVEVRATGTWEGAKVAWTHRYTNSGWLAKRTGDLFAF